MGCEPRAIISEISNLWGKHKSQEWDSLYNSVPPETRLFSFIKGFINSPFVLTNFDEEIQFRDELAVLFSSLVPEPCNKKHSVTILQNILHKLKQKRQKASISKLCDLNSLLG